MIRKSNPFNNTGFALLDILAAITIFALLLPGVIAFFQMSSRGTSQNAAAGHMQRIAVAAKQYVLNNHNDIVSGASASNSYDIALSDLKNEGYLPSAYGTLNSWGQTYNIYAFNPEDEDIHLVVLTTGGRGGGSTEFENKVIPAAAAKLGAEGGYVPTGQIPGESLNVLQGAYGGWKFSLSGTDIFNPGSGHLAYSEYIAQEQFGNDYLYRLEVPGHPDVNRMSTTLDMDGNTILMGDGNVGGGDGEGVRKVNFEDHSSDDFDCADNDDYGGSVFYDRDEGLYVCRMGRKVKIADEGNHGFFQGATIKSDGDTVLKPDCLNSNPQIFVAPTTFAEGSSSDSIKAVQAWAEDLSSSEWEVHMRVLTNNGWSYPDADYGKVLTITKCSK